jgi:hypothetical protein
MKLHFPQTCVALFCLILHACPGHAADLCPLVAELNRTVADLTGHAPPTCPVIGFVDLPEFGGVRSQAGAYFPLTQRIELAPDLDLTTVFGQSYLLHELVHAAQFAAGADKTALCPAALEAEAYTVQAAFLRQHGLGEQALTVQLIGMQLGSCGTQADY